MSPRTHYAVASIIEDSQYHGFRWPESGRATRDEVVSGMPESARLKVFTLPLRQPAAIHWQEESLWIILTIADEHFDLEKEGRIRFTEGEVIFRGNPRSACAYIETLGLPAPRSFQLEVGNDWQSAEAGEFGIAIAGQESTAMAGDHGIGIAPSQCGCARSGYRGISLGAGAITGDYGVAVADIEATAGKGGIAVITDEFGKAAAGDGGIAINDTGGTSVTGEGGLAITADNGKVQAGPGGLLAVRSWMDGTWYTAKVGENGIEPNVPYRIDEDGNFERAD